MSECSSLRSEKLSKCPSIINYLPKSQKNKSLINITEGFLKRTSISTTISQRQQILLNENKNLKDHNKYLLSQLMELVDIRRYIDQITNVSSNIISQLRTQNNNLKLQIIQMRNFGKISIQKMENKINQFASSYISFKTSLKQTMNQKQQLVNDLQQQKLNQKFQQLIIEQNKVLCYLKKRQIRKSMMEIINSLTQFKTSSLF